MSLFDFQRSKFFKNSHNNIDRYNFFEKLTTFNLFGVVVKIVYLLLINELIRNSYFLTIVIYYNKNVKLYSTSFMNILSKVLLYTLF